MSKACSEIDRAESNIFFDLITGCWLWAASTYPRGYGRFSKVENGKRKNVLAHKFMFEALKGSVSKGLELDHLCKNPRCVNPAHLEPVSHKENVRRGRAGKYCKDKTHCPKGHEYNFENTWIGVSKRGNYRRCKICLKNQWTLSNKKRRSIG